MQFLSSVWNYQFVLLLLFNTNTRFLRKQKYAPSCATF